MSKRALTLSAYLKMQVETQNRIANSLAKLATREPRRWQRVIAIDVTTAGFVGLLLWALTGDVVTATQWAVIIANVAVASSVVAISAVLAVAGIFGWFLTAVAEANTVTTYEGLQARGIIDEEGAFVVKVDP